MSLIDRLKERLTRKKLTQPKIQEELVQEVIETVKDEDMTEEQTLAKMVEMFKKYPELREKVDTILDAEENLAEPLAKVAVEIADRPDIPDKVAVDITTQLPKDEQIKVLDNANLSYGAKLEIIDSVPDSKEKEEQISKELQDLYDKCSDMNPLDIARETNRLIGVYKRTEPINNIIYQIIAKNLAKSYYQFNGGIKIKPFETIIPPAEMLREEVPDRIHEEYQQLLEPEEKDKFNKDDINKKLLSDAAKEVVKLAKKNDRPETAYVMNMGTLTAEQQNHFIKQVKIYKEGKLSEHEEQVIFNKLNNIEENESEIEEINLKLQEVTGSTIRSIASLSPYQMEIVGEIIDSGLVKALGRESKNDRAIYIDIVTETLENRKMMQQKREEERKQLEKEEKEPQINQDDKKQEDQER